MYDTIVTIDGISMLPTLHNGEKYYATTDFDLTVDSIYVYYKPDGDLVVKRLTEIKDNLCYFLGDNLEHSIDSREYGYINAENIVAKLIDV